MSYNLDMEYIVEQLVRIATTPSPVGYTNEVIELIAQEFNRLGLSTRILNKGGLVATLRGTNDTAHRTLSGHVDTLGAMVKEIKGNGRLRFTRLGGYMYNSVEGEHCTIITSTGQKYTGTILTTKQSSHVYGADAAKQERSEDNMEIRLDEVVKSRDDVKKLGIGVGDFVAFDPRTTVTESGFIKSRHLDDKASVAVLLGVAKYLTENKRKKLVALAEEHNLPYAVDIYPNYGSDAGPALRAGNDIRTALIGPGVDASHAHERTHKSALEATAKLCVAYLLS